MDEDPTGSLIARIRDGWRLLGSPAALSWPVPMLSVVFGVIGPLAIDRQRLGGSLLGWLIVALLAQAVLILVVLICRPLAGRSPVLTVMVLAVASAARGLALAVSASTLGLSNGMELGYRIGPAAIAQFGILVALALAVSSYARHQSVAADLATKRRSVTGLTEGLRGRLDAIRGDLARQVHATIDPLLGELDRELERLEREGDATKALASIRRAVDNDLRPLSHRLSESVEVPSAANDAGPGSELPRVPMPERLPLSLLITPWAVGVLTAIVASSQSHRAPSAVGAVFFPVLTGMLTAGLMWAVRLLAGRWAPRLWLGVALTALITGAVMSFSLGIQRSVDLPVPRFVGTAALFAGFVIGAVTALYVAVDARRSATESQLRNSITELEDVASILRQHTLAARRDLSRVLHGSVQSSLHAAAMRLAAEDHPTSELIRAVRADIIAAIGRLDEPEPDRILLVDTLADIVELWDGTCTIRWTLDHRTVRRLALSPVVAANAAEITRECVTNAIKHGGATEVWISIGCSGDRVVVSALDNGNGDEVGLPGFGSRLLDEACADWRRERVDGGTRVIAELAMAER